MPPITDQLVQDWICSRISLGDLLVIFAGGIALGFFLAWWRRHSLRRHQCPVCGRAFVDMPVIGADLLLQTGLPDEYANRRAIAIVKYLACREARGDCLGTMDEGTRAEALGHIANLIAIPRPK
jgi:hypothetical protein